MKQQIKIDRHPVRLLFVSEPYVIYSLRGYQAVADVIDIKSKKEYYIYLSAKSLADVLNKLTEDNNNSLIGIEVWVCKQSDDKSAKYEVEE